MCPRSKDLQEIRRRRRRGEAGFTLVEAMLASFVFVVGALGLLGLMYNSAAGLTAATNITYATSVARAKLEELTARPYNHADLSVGDHQPDTKNIGPAGTPFDPQGNATGDINTDDGWFARSWSVTEVNANSFKNIVVRVRWYDKTTKMARYVTMAGGKSVQ
jgi:Tfp pilus assembly protein PilV